MTAFSGTRPGQGRMTASAEYVTGLAGVVRSLVVLLLALVSAAPWGVPETAAPVLPMLVFAAIAYWSWGAPRAIPVFVVFLAGAIYDLLSGGPVGYWATLWLIGHWAACAVPLREFRYWWVWSWLSLGVLLAGVVVVGWVVTSLYLLRLGDIGPLVNAALLVVLIYPPISGALALIDLAFGAIRRVLD